MQLEFNLTYFVIFSLTSIIATFLTAKYSKIFFAGSLLDKDFLKPQAFHKEPTARIGGFTILFLFILFIIFYFFVTGVFLKNYFIAPLSLFILGFLDDLKIKINPNIRLLLMVVILLICINIFSIQISRSGLEFLDTWLENNIFQICFILLCFLFVINGANLIDGFNGLLAIHFLIINSIFLAINLTNQNESTAIILFSQIIIVFSFLLFNFPKAKIFLGDSGSYLLGTLIALNAIRTYELNTSLSPFFLAVVLFYLFYEVFFSFIRKVVLRIPPLQPDGKHLHMLLYNWLYKSKKIKKPNYLSSTFINLTYLSFQIPLFYFQNDGLVLKYSFFLLISFYTVVYLRLYSLSKKQINI
ncbi:glycosyltransferase [Pelagibacteraceae bacterium]|nr:glycosyltransferase [Pelagibacteraceae bacterium]